MINRLINAFDMLFHKHEYKRSNGYYPLKTHRDKEIRLLPMLRLKCKICGKVKKVINHDAIKRTESA